MEQDLVSIEVDIGNDLLALLRELTKCNDDSQGVKLAVQGYLKIKSETQLRQRPTVARPDK